MPLCDVHFIADTSFSSPSRMSRELPKTEVGKDFPNVRSHSERAGEKGVSLSSFQGYENQSSTGNHLSVFSMGRNMILFPNYER